MTNWKRTGSATLCLLVVLFVSSPAQALIRGYSHSVCDVPITELSVQAESLATSDRSLCGTESVPSKVGNTLCKPVSSKGCRSFRFRCVTQYKCVTGTAPSNPIESRENELEPIQSQATPAAKATPQPTASVVSQRPEVQRPKALPSVAVAATVKPLTQIASPAPQPSLEVHSASKTGAQISGLEKTEMRLKEEAKPMAVPPVDTPGPSDVAQAPNPTAVQQQLSLNQSVDRAQSTPDVSALEDSWWKGFVSDPAVQGRLAHAVEGEPVLLGIGTGTFFFAALMLMMLLSVWRILEKAEFPGYYAAIPVLNQWKLHEVAGQPGWFVVLDFIPGINLLSYLALNVGLARRFGHGVPMGLLLSFLPFFGYPYLGFSTKVQYSAV